jgi:predicted membrane protein
MKYQHFTLRTIDFVLALAERHLGFWDDEIFAIYYVAIVVFKITVLWDVTTCSLVEVAKVASEVSEKNLATTFHQP